MKIRSKLANWMSKSRPRLYFLIVLLMLLPIPFFAYSVTQVLRQQTEKQAITESTQIARVSAALIEQHFRRSTAFLEAFAVRQVFRHAWMEHNFVAYSHQYLVSSRVTQTIVKLLEVIQVHEQYRKFVIWMPLSAVECLAQPVQEKSAVRQARLAHRERHCAEAVALLVCAP